MPQEYIIYGVLVLLFLIFLIVFIKTNKDKIYELYESIYKMDLKEKEEMTDETASDEKDNNENNEPKVTQLSLFHENYQKEIEEIKILADSDSKETKKNPIDAVLETDEVIQETIEENFSYDYNTLKQLTVIELREIAKAHNLYSYTRLNKVELIKFIIESLKR
jgi:hypothetical protein